MSAPSAYAVTAATTARRSTESTMAALYRAALGPIGAARYLPAFERFDEAGRTLPGWNWAAALLTLNWMVFRQLWSAALVYVAALEGLALLAVAVGRYTGTWPIPVLAGLGMAVLLAATVIPGLYGNAIVHGEIRKRITKALAASATLAQAQERLEANAPTQRRLVWIGAANAMLAVLLAALLLFQPDLSAMGPAAASHAPPAAAQAPASDAPSHLPGDASAAAGTAGPTSVPAAAPPTSAPSAAESTDGASRPATPTAQASALVPASASSRVAVLPSTSAAAASLPMPPRQAASAASRAMASPATAASAASPAVAPASAASTASSPTVPGNASARSPAASAAAPASAPSAASRRTAVPAASRPAAPATADRTDSAAVPARKLYINVGLFAEPANAQRAHGMLRGAGIPASTQPITAADGRELLRVRAGPFTSASQANAAAARIRALGLETSAAAAQRP
ncbi:SPOR domain-containing protein [Paracidovorax oryzae]|uniref:SPOR domain-containing protein n=1 Tax=Paracidovorax oryzae TaxID=862720 RepID=UPI0035D0E636